MRAYHEEYRYRVISVRSYYQGPRGDGSNFFQLYANEIKEFKTYEAAKECEKRWAAQGVSVLFQTGKVTWMTPEEQEAEVATLPKVME